MFQFHVKRYPHKHLYLWLVVFLLAVIVLFSTKPAAAQVSYSEDEVIQAIESFFGTGAKGIADVVRKVFKEQGQPQAIVTGEEAGAAIGIGARYGQGTLQMKGRGAVSVYWQGPSIGLDIGANANKVYALVYNLPDANSLFQRYPGVEGSLYYIGGVGVTYLQSGNTVIAPIRFGAGFRQGINVGYMNFSREKRLNPF